ncbi:hypothetical protein KCP91_15240 [Microvirga sp. SRT01]|jgi:hypothetical protein|uniref:Uncharacterized protein n=1 Tax=Sphingomonas longa TaxID=2778730 RepID=A0ABS2D9W3_9SPHN|nr:MULTISPECIES: hypothetical protein [Alphaproteobacteria]MBM6577736.1 hypothetical protein [Sphingomonas sp. BT552]MBR7710778.1 hypothetical protein [Microvirga sp. SRT01]
MDLQDPNLVAQNQNAVTPSVFEFNIPIVFRNLSGSTASVGAVICISEAGPYRSANA